MTFTSVCIFSFQIQKNGMEIALDIWERRGPKVDKDVLVEWRKLERPLTPEPLPTKDATTTEQRHLALALHGGRCSRQ